MAPGKKPATTALLGNEGQDWDSDCSAVVQLVARIGFGVIDVVGSVVGVVVVIVVGVVVDIVDTVDVVDVEEVDEEEVVVES